MASPCHRSGHPSGNETRACNVLLPRRRQHQAMIDVEGKDATRFALNTGSRFDDADAARRAPALTHRLDRQQIQIDGGPDVIMCPRVRLYEAASIEATGSAR